MGSTPYQTQLESLGQDAVLRAVRIEGWSGLSSTLRAACPLQLMGRSPRDVAPFPVVLSWAALPGIRIEALPVRSHSQWLHVHQYLLCDHPRDPQMAQAVLRRFEAVISLVHRQLSPPTTLPFDFQERLHVWLAHLFHQLDPPWGVVGDHVVGDRGGMIKRRGLGDWGFSEKVPAEFIDEANEQVVDKSTYHLVQERLGYPHVPVSGAIDWETFPDADCWVNTVYSVIEDVATASAQVIAEDNVSPPSDGYIRTGKAAELYVNAEIEYEITRQTARNRIHSLIRQKNPRVRSEKRGGEVWVNETDLWRYLNEKRKQELDQER